MKKRKPSKIEIQIAITISLHTCLEQRGIFGALKEPNGRVLPADHHVRVLVVRHQIERKDGGGKAVEEFRRRRVRILLKRDAVHVVSCVMKSV